MILIFRILSSILFYFTLFDALYSILSDSNSISEAYKTYLSTKTPYRFIENLDISKVQFEGCVPRKLWAVIRHGTRTPGKRTSNEMRSRLVELRDLVTENFNGSYRNSLNQIFDLANLKKWRPHKELDDKKRLTTAGEKEMINLARNFKKRFPDLFSESWSNSSYLLKYTDTQRTKASAEFFAKGLFGQSGARNVWYPTPLKRDPVLRFYKLCDKWRLQVKDDPGTKTHWDRFLQTKIFINMLEELRIRFGLTSLNTDDVRSMYTACCFETAWDESKRSPWCTMFAEDEFKVLEYVEDLEYYWIDGYGHDLTSKIGCVMLEDVMQHFRANTNPRPPAVMYFTHSGTILKFLSNLGLYKDSTPLEYNNYLENENRMWRTSKIDTFGSNIAFILFDCDSGGQHVLTLHQERPVTLPGCPANKHLCPMKVIEKTYQKNLMNCDFHNLCRITNESILQKTGAYLWNFLNMVRETYFSRLERNFSEYWSFL